MKKIIQFNLLFIICIFLVSIFLSCAKKEETADPENSSSSSSSTNTESYTCSAGSGAGAGPAIGDINLDKATYLSTCFSSRKYQMEIKDNTSVQLTFYTYGDSSCSGSGTETFSSCIQSLSVTSTTVNKPTYVNGSVGDNVTGYYATGTWIHDSSTSYLNLAADNSSVFWWNMSETQSGLDSNTHWILKLTKQ